MLYTRFVCWPTPLAKHWPNSATANMHGITHSCERERTLHACTGLILPQRYSVVAELPVNVTHHTIQNINCSETMLHTIWFFLPSIYSFSARAFFSSSLLRLPQCCFVLFFLCSFISFRVRKHYAYLAATPDCMRAIVWVSLRCIYIHIYMHGVYKADEVFTYWRSWLFLFAHFTTGAVNHTDKYVNWKGAAQLCTCMVLMYTHTHRPMSSLKIGGYTFHACKYGTLVYIFWNIWRISSVDLKVVLCMSYNKKWSVQLWYNTLAHCLIPHGPKTRNKLIAVNIFPSSLHEPCTQSLELPFTFVCSGCCSILFLFVPFPRTGKSLVFEVVVRCCVCWGCYFFFLLYTEWVMRKASNTSSVVTQRSFQHRANSFAIGYCHRWMEK